MYHHNMTCVYYTIFFFVVVFMLHSQRTPTLAQCPYYPSSGTYIPNHNVSEIDRNVLEFALNLEFLEAEFFLWSGLGFGLDQVAPQLVMGGPSPVGGEIATLDEFTHNITVQLALQEVGHLRAILATIEGFPRPLLNLSRGVFEQLMNHAFGRQLEPPFNPYQDSLSFMIASYALPYVGMTGLVGANPLLESYTAKRLVAAILGVEAGQDGLVRTYLYKMKDVHVQGYGFTVAEFTSRISQLRNRLGSTSGLVDEGLQVAPASCLGAEGRLTQNLLSADAFSLTYSRTTLQILRILYGTGSESTPGAFFPQGARGAIAEAALEHLTSSHDPFMP